MPTYEYACTVCDHAFDVRQSFSDPALTECPECGGRLKKVYGSIGVQFKGSGFYRTDSRAGAKSASVPAGSSGGSSGSGSSGSKDSGPRDSGSSASSGSSTSASSSSAGSSASGTSSTAQSTPAAAAS